MKPTILFLGNPERYSWQVKEALIKANYKITEDPQKAQLIISVAFGKKIPNKILNSTKFGGLNLHPSLLPKYRGATPIPHALLNQEKQTGISIIKMTNQIDAGPILIQKKVTIKPTDTTPDLLSRCFQLGTKLLLQVLPDYLNNKLTLKPQPKNSPTSCCYTFKKQEGFITWKKFSKSIKTNFSDLDHKIRALYPWPGIWTKLPASQAGEPNQKILKILPNQLLQLEGKQPITVKQFVSGYQQFL